jgi:hypothetical protein
VAQLTGADREQLDDLGRAKARAFRQRQSSG